MKTIRRPISILLAVLMVVGMFTMVPISAGAATWTFKLNSNFSGAWNADTDVVSEQPVELNLAEGDYEFQIVAYEDGTISAYRGNEVAGSFTENYSQVMHDNGGNAKFHADGGKYTLTYDAGTGVVTIAPVYVAEVGGTQYKTLEAAIDAAQAGDTVELLADITLDAQTISGESVKYGAYITKSLTIDGNGHTITSNAERAIGVKGVGENVDVTFKNVTINNKVKGAICICTRGGIGNLMLDNVTLDTQGCTKGYNQPLTIGGTQTTQAKVTVKDSVIQTNDEASKYYAIILWNPVDLTIQDSTIKGWACVYQKAFADGTTDKTEVTIDNSTLISKGLKGSSNHFAAIHTEEGDFSCTVTNSTINVTAAENTYQGIAASNGSADGFEVNLGAGNDVTLTGDTAVIGFNFDETEHEIAVSGGTFNKPVDEEYCAEGFIPATLDEETGVYSVKNGSYVAQIGDTKYETLEAAFAAAQDGDTIKVLADCAGNGIKVPQGKFATGLTVDFDGHTYTVDGETVGSLGTETNGFQLLKDNNITFKNGTLYSEKALFLVQNYSNLTLDNMTLTLNNAGYTGAYTLSNNNGDVVINDTTINANPDGVFAFDVCRYSSYPSVNVTVTGNSVINGDVEVYASGSNAKNGFSLNLLEGTMNGDIIVDPSAATAMANAPEKASVNKDNTFVQDPAAGYKWRDNGDGTSTLVKADLFAGYGLTLHGDIGLIFYLDPAAAGINADDVNSLSVSFTCDKYTGTVTDFTKSGDYLKVTYYVPAAYMASPIHAYAVTINGNVQADTDDYSVQQYAQRIIADPVGCGIPEAKAAAAVTLMKEMLNYGAKAQTVFATQMSNPISQYVPVDGYTMADVTAADIDAAIHGTATDMSTVHPEADANFYAPSVIYLSKTTLRMIFEIPTGNGSNNPDAYTGSQSNWYYWKDVTDIPAAELDDQQQFNVNGTTFNYSVLDYAKAVVSGSGSQANKDLAASLYLYNQAANAYYE